MLSDAGNAQLYDLMYPWDAARFPSDAFYEDLVTAAEAVLDIGCGTGRMLHRARERGHPGRLVGLDPDRAALDRARQRTGIEWVDGVAADAAWDREFDLATMTTPSSAC
ncbi:MAG TPA: class I SAM-dependent methyltransferase [Pseudonocardiaceae bacterium]|nr:class I SAM-dependent methyltransferase [Pseudonocardiaceae bacterium]